MLKNIEQTTLKIKSEKQIYIKNEVLCKSLC